MNVIVAVSRTWGIGKGGDLLFHFRKDMRFFREMTLGKTVIMGRKTLDSFPGGKPLPKRRNIVLTRSAGFSREGVEVCHGTEDLALLLAGTPESDVFVIGGGEIYRQLLPFCSRAYVTLVDEDPPAEIRFPDLSREEGWQMTGLSDPVTEDGSTFRFSIWTREDPHGL